MDSPSKSLNKNNSVSVSKSQNNLSMDSSGANLDEKEGEKKEKPEKSKFDKLPKDDPRRDLPNFEECCCLSESTTLNIPIIDLFDLNNPRLQHIFNKETSELKKSFAALKKTQQDKNLLKYEIMLCFWFSIHHLCLEEAKLLYTLDPMIGEIMQQLRAQGQEELQKKE